MAVNIKVSEIKILFSKIIEKLEKENVKIINLNVDGYRFIPADEWENFTEDVILLGSLLDDVDNLRKLIEDDNRPCTYVDFDRLASLLMAISYNKNPI